MIIVGTLQKSTTRRVMAYSDKEMDKLYPKEWPVLVEVTLTDGRRVSRRLDKVIGCPSQPMTDEGLSRKFLDNTVPLLGTGGAERVLEACLNLEELEDAGEFVRWLMPRE